MQPRKLVQVRREDELSYSVGGEVPPLVWVRLTLKLPEWAEGRVVRDLPLVCPNCGSGLYEVHLVRRCPRCFYVD